METLQQPEEAQYCACVCMCVCAPLCVQVHMCAVNVNIHTFPRVRITQRVWVEHVHTAVFGVNNQQKPTV